MIDKNELYRTLKTIDKEKALRLSLESLLNREITKQEFHMMALKLKLGTQKNAEEMIKELFDVNIRKNLTINDLPKMNYLETRTFLNNLINKGLKHKTIINELYIMWDEGRITGFDYRYTVEALGEEVSEEFKTQAEMIGRYDY